MDSFTIAGPTSGPDLNYTYSYTSILRLGLAAGDTPDAPHKVSRPLSLWRRAYNLRRQSKLEASLEDPTRRVKALLRKAKNVGRIMRKTYICSHSLALISPDLSIGGASPDTLPAPSDECFVAADLDPTRDLLLNCPKSSKLFGITSFALG
ncbi:putative carboxylesterase 16 [Dorcoceras hygrometricum]|uniref:Putative carboxylesterase 16 n=1 Tax=Dorcoceras hygrometricum TaxID=472368 RepID=A0A2Z7AD48_9LAMI|nr:putative carboxylesterase 16 [Dorcoceras hygrometricum]